MKQSLRDSGLASNTPQQTSNRSQARSERADHCLHRQYSWANKAQNVNVDIAVPVTTSLPRQSTDQNKPHNFNASIEQNQLLHPVSRSISTLKRHNAR